MKQKRSPIIKLGILVLLCGALGRTSYAMDLGGFEVQMGTGEAAFPLEEWEGAPQVPIAPEGSFQEETRGEVELPGEFPVLDGAGEIPEMVPYPEILPVPENVPYPEVMEEPVIQEFPPMSVLNQSEKLPKSIPVPTESPTKSPTESPTESPTVSPTPSPTRLPSLVPTATIAPTDRPTPILEEKKEELEVQYKSHRFLKGQAVALSLPSSGTIHVLSCRVNGQEKPFQWKGNTLLVPYEEEEDAHLEMLLLCESHRRF